MGSSDTPLFNDDRLKLLFIACHPQLPYEGQLCLTLKVVAGLSVEQIAKAFLSSPQTIAQRIVRAKKKIKELAIPFEMPPQKDLSGRMEAVLNAIYLLFNEGYASFEGEELFRVDVCREAIRLVSLLVEHPAGNIPKVHALKALLLLQASRLPARIAADGAMVLLPEQDRTLWDQTLVQQGIYHLGLARNGTELSSYHLQAGIAACHCLAKSYEQTDWPSILWYYQQLLCLSPSPIFALNQAVALSFVEGDAVALKALESLQKEPRLQNYYLYYATIAQMQLRCNHPAQAIESYIEALSLARTKPEKALLLKKLAACKQEFSN
jgi:RNA polymerase sigma-70 factor (ECF subfamily)